MHTRAALSHTGIGFGFIDGVQRTVNVSFFHPMFPLSAFSCTECVKEPIVSICVRVCVAVGDTLCVSTHEHLIFYF